MRLLVFLFPLIFVACGHNIKEDPNVSAIDAKYSTAEIRVQSQISNGLVIAAIEKGKPLADLKLQVQGYYEGRIQVVSTDCEIDYVANYRDSALVTIPLRGKVTKDCGFAVSVSPTLPKQDNSSIVVYPLNGWVMLRAKEKNEVWVGTTRKIPANGTNTWKIKTGDTKPVRVVLSNCGMRTDRIIEPTNGEVHIPLGNAIAHAPLRSCVMYGTIVSPDFKNVALNALISIYDRRYVPLAIPAISVKNGKLNVDAGPNVSIIALNDKVEFNNVASFDFSTSGSYTLRAATVKGRTIIGIYKNGAWKWNQ